MTLNLMKDGDRLILLTGQGFATLRDALLSWAAKLPQRRMASLTIEEHKHPKTYQQLRLYFRLLNILDADLKNQGNFTIPGFTFNGHEVKTSVGNLDSCFKWAWAASNMTDEPPSKAAMSIEELSSLIEDVFVYASNAGIETGAE
ncbi:unnamed protein product [marine sediment metagenome]|uniref:Uncharacterized protein n=1 Tax=marine sediment metagenome TaxID=412755 RepID=X0SZ82_9ZZZZ